MVSIPKVSIITVVLNDKDGIQRTINSVREQTYQNLEFIIIDGESIDGTVKTLNDNDKIITQWVSEKDNGLYDAMNKGTELASGEWVIFLNAGHIFYTSDAISNVFNSESISDYDIVYGDLVYEFNFGDVVKSALDISNLWKGMSFAHQSTFIKTNLCKTHKYKLEYKFASDFNLFYQFYKSGYTFIHIDNIISKRKVSGNTDSNIIKSTIERYKIVTKDDSTIQIHIYYQLLTIKYLLRKIIPTILLKLYYRGRYKNRTINQ